MDFSKQNISNYYLYDTGVENLFISEYMEAAPGEYVKAYLLALMCAQLNKPVSSEDIGRKAGLDPAAMGRCWDYWEKLGVIIKNYPDPGDKSRYTVEMSNLREGLFGSRKPAQSSKLAASLDDKALAKLYRDVEAAAGRQLSGSEPEEIASWIKDYQMDPLFILFGYKFCSEKRKSTKCRYVGTVLKDWKSKGLNSTADVEEHLAEVDRNYNLYRRVFKELGFSRSPSEEEKRIMGSWFEEYGFELEKVLQACKKTSGISNPNINYVDSVLRAWRKEAEGKEENSQEELLVKLEKLYEKDRQENEARTEKMREKIFTEIPRIKIIMEELREAAFKMSRFMLMGENGKENLEKEKKKADRLRQERSRLLAERGYGESALESIYTCSKCRDTGLNEDGTRCSCYREKLKLLT